MGMPAAVLWDIGGRMSILWLPESRGQWSKWEGLSPAFPDDLKWWVTESLQDGKFIPYQGLFDYKGKW